jgi:hypothetical protein
MHLWKSSNSTTEMVLARYSLQLPHDEGACNQLLNFVRLLPIMLL